MAEDTTPLGCRGLFDCLADCFTSECEDACIARGTSEGLTRARALATCSTQNSCETEQCLLSNCDPQLRSCAEIGPSGAGGGGGGSAGGTAGGSAGGAAGGSAGGGSGGVTCSPAIGTPELTGSLQGLQASYARGETITATIPVDADTQRLYVTIYQFGGTLQLGSTAENVMGSSVTVSLPAGTVGGPTGTFYLSTNLCSTNDCGHPMTRNVYGQTGSGANYTETRTTSGSADIVCTSPIPITTFQIQ